MLRHNHVHQVPGSSRSIIITIDNVQHTLTEDAFLALMADALRVLQSIGHTHEQAKRGATNIVRTLPEGGKILPLGSNRPASSH